MKNFFRTCRPQFGWDGSNAETSNPAESSPYNPGFLDAVITIDSPLHVVPPTDTVLGAIIPGLGCVTNGQSAGILVGLHNNKPNTTKSLIQTAHKAKSKGIRVVTAGNTYDCVWQPATCLVPLAGDLDTQWISNSDAIVALFSIPEPCLSPLPRCFTGTHSAALDKRHGSESLQVIANYIGMQK